MKKTIVLILTLAAGMFSSSQVSGQAELQVIHNCADPGAQTVDVYVNGANAIDNFAFRAATPFLNLPSGVVLNIGIAPGNSTSVNDTLVNFPVVLAAGEKYVAVASGVLTPSTFSNNPDGKNIGFGLNIITNAQTASAQPGNVDITILHGSTDAPAVDVIARGVATLADNASFGDYTPYIGVPPASYIVDITPAADNSNIIVSYTADLSGLAGGAAVVFASGFLNPAANQNGEAFGVFAALPNGAVVPLPTTSQARLQVIHNAADPGAASVDVYLNGALAIPGFAFRAATPFLDVPAGVPVNIGIAPPNSTSANDTLVNFTVTFNNGETYLAVANGVLNPPAFAANPDGRPTGFTLFLQSGIRESSQNGTGNVDFIAIHGSTDAPTVDVIARGVATLVDNAAYGDITPYISVPAASYLLDITPGNSNNTIVASYTADLSALGGGSAIVFASGFLNPGANQNGAAFGLYAALGNGTVVALPATSQARLQVIHNAADPAAASVDVYLNGALALNNFAFRTATPFIDVPGDALINIGIAPGNSTSVNDTLVNIPVTLANGQTYVAIANGVLNPAAFAANPDGRPTGFNLFLQNNIRESALNGTEVDFIALHGATDAPTVDIKLTGGPVLIDNAAYGDITPYINVPAASYSLDVTPGNNNSVVVASYQADLSTLGGGAAVVFASGFLNPGANQNGAAFGLWVTLPNGTTFPLPVTTSIGEIDNASTSVSIYPNPAVAGSSIYVNNNTNGVMTLEMINAAGQIVRSIEANYGENAIETNGLRAGVYTVRTITGENVSTGRVVIR
ncbi:MAG: DUF4397 domain-containing protein [Bacteroidota bacterium]|jgi:hypothetical protein